jgi:hypothetical protein
MAWSYILESFLSVDLIPQGLRKNTISNTWCRRLAEALLYGVASVCRPAVGWRGDAGSTGVGLLQGCDFVEISCHDGDSHGPSIAVAYLLMVA